MTNKFITDNILKVILGKLYDWMPFKKGKNHKVIGDSGLEAQNDFEVAFGEYNESNPGTIFSVGVGDVTQRQNAIEIKEDGEILIKKDLDGIAMVSLQDVIGQTAINPPSAIEDDFINSLPNNK